MRKTEAVPGKPIVMKLREDEEDIVCKWLNLQNVYGDSIRYLIQQEIAVNGLRNLQQFIPQHRTVETLRPLLQTTTAPSNFMSEDKKNHSFSGTNSIPPPSTSHVTEPLVPVVDALSSSDIIVPSVEQTFDQGNEIIIKEEIENPPAPPVPLQPATNISGNKRSASKKFGSDVLESYSN